MTPKETLQAAMLDLGLVVEAEFVPWSKSRSFKSNAKVTERSLNWRVTLKRVTPGHCGRGSLCTMRPCACRCGACADAPIGSSNARVILTTDYTAGIGHAPSYKQGRMTLDTETALAHETEKGTVAKPSANLGSVFSGKPIALDVCDVVSALASDSDAIDHPSFESWAGDLGYDTGSRSAEKTYRACLETALALRAGLGDAGLSKLRNACEGY
jgi:hypothetical protein